MKTPRYFAGRSKTLGLIALAALIGGCASSNGLAPQGKPVDPSQLSSARTLSAGEGAQSKSWPDADWWRALGDPQLDTLVDEALRGNPDLAIADARVRLASAESLGADASRALKVNAMGTVQGIYMPETIAPEPFGDSYVSVKVLGVNGSYTFDPWGGERATWEAAVGRQRAMEVDANAARLALSVDVARAYAQLGYAFLAHDLAQEDAKRADQLFTLSRQRVAAGIESLAQQRQAEAIANAAQQRLAQASLVIESDRIALAVLVGKGPDRGADIARPAVLHPVALAIPDNLPADLLGRRPDIVASRWRVEATSRGIDAAKAGFYPNINMTAMLGLVSLHTSDLLSLRSRYYFLAPAISLPVFDGGRLRAKLAQRDADYDLAVAQYNKTLVTAFNQVATRIKAAQSLAEQEAAQSRAAAAAREAWNLAMERYQRGIGSYVEVLSVQQTLIATEAMLATIHLQQIDASVQLVQALGGGYQTASVSPAVPAESAPTTRTPS